MNVLIVDDDADFRHMVGEYLSSSERFEVVGEAKNGVEAIARAAELQPDLVLMDISMPVMGGIEAAAQIHTASPNISIMVVSGLNDDDPAAVAAASGAGIIGRLKKRDFSVAALVEIIDGE